MSPAGPETRGAESASAWRPSSGTATLPPDFFARPALEVARDLLGRRLVSTVDGRRAEGRIVETEAYVGLDDPACHAARRIGRTARNEAMFGPPGTAYVYFIYGMHWCLNAVAARVGDPQAVLIRALEPLRGIEVMTERRGRAGNLTRGPARLCQALGVEGTLNAHPLFAAPLWIEEGRPLAEDRVQVTGRIGIREASDWPLRFLDASSSHVSPGRPRTAEPA